MCLFFSIPCTKIEQIWLHTAEGGVLLSSVIFAQKAQVIQYNYIHSLQIL
jgi:hypothetical protein